jgi:hypothetical protein
MLRNARGIARGFVAIETRLKRKHYARPVGKRDEAFVAAVLENRSPLVLRLNYLEASADSSRGWVAVSGMGPAVGMAQRIVRFQSVIAVEVGFHTRHQTSYSSPAVGFNTPGGDVLVAPSGVTQISGLSHQCGLP